MAKAYNKVSANTASSVPQSYEKSEGSQDARRGSPDMPNQPLEQQFQDMYGMNRQKLTVWPGIDFVCKNWS